MAETRTVWRRSRNRGNHPVENPARVEAIRALNQAAAALLTLDESGDWTMANYYNVQLADALKALTTDRADDVGGRTPGEFADVCIGMAASLGYFAYEQVEDN